MLLRRLLARPSSRYSSHPLTLHSSTLKPFHSYPKLSSFPSPYRRLARLGPPPAPPAARLRQLGRNFTTTSKNTATSTSRRRNSYWVIEIENEYGENIERVFKVVLALTVLSPIAYFVYVDTHQVELARAALQRERVHPATPKVPFFGRQEEIAELRALLDRSPDKITVVTGPSDTGKTSMLSQVVATREYAARFNLRASTAHSVDDFVRYFNKVTGAEFLSFRSWIVDMLPWKGGEGNFELRDRLSHLELQQSLACLRKTLEEIKRDPSVKQVPVIMFDEFGTLLDLASDREGIIVLETLLHWFLEVTKNRLAHCVLAITDAQVIRNMSFFNSRNVSGRSRFVCIGDFTEADAREYMRLRLDALGLLTDDEEKRKHTMDEMYRVVGGRPLDIDTCINELRMGSAVEDALSRMVAVARERAYMSLHIDGIGLLSSIVLNEQTAYEEVAAPKREAGEEVDPLFAQQCTFASAAGVGVQRPGDPQVKWSARQLWMVMQALINSPHGYVRMDDMHTQLQTLDDDSPTPGREALEELIAADIIGIRVGATPDLVDCEDDGSYYITADSPVMMAAFRDIAKDPAVCRAMLLHEQLVASLETFEALNRRRLALKHKIKGINISRREVALNIDILEALFEQDQASPEEWRRRARQLLKLESGVAQEMKSVEEQYDAIMLEHRAAKERHLALLQQSRASVQ